jgi:S-(hydroxymethyl)glutathione dehydrogenase/alcohol dehydrogenase
MKAAILHEFGRPLVLQDVALSAPLPGEVRVRVVASGLCHSDYHRMTGGRPCPLPAVLGHEVSGLVEVVGGDVSHVKVGDPVVVGLASCGMCHECRSGFEHRCDAPPARHGGPRVTRRGQDVFQFVSIGGFAEAVLVDGRGVVKAPEGMPLDLAALLGCAVTSGVGAVIHCAKVRPGQSVAVIGCGGVGLNVVQGARIAGASQIVAIDTSPAKLELARAFGATHAVAAGADVVGAVRELCEGGVDYAFEVVGRTDTILQAVAMLGKGGAAVLVGIPTSGTEVPIPTDLIFRNELRVLSTINGSAGLQASVEELGRFYREGRLQLEPLVSQRIELADVNRGYEQLAAGEVARSLITFGDRG